MPRNRSGSEASITPERRRTAHHISGSAVGSSQIGKRAASVLRCFSALCVAILCAVAGGSSPTYTLIVGPRVPAWASSGRPFEPLYTPVSGLIGDLNGDGAPDIVLGINGSPPAVYLNNGTVDPFQNVQGVFVAPPPGPTMPGISWGAAVLVDVNADGHPDLAIAGFNAPNMIYLNNGTSTPFNGVSGIAIGTQDVAYAPAFGDVNGDGFRRYGGRQYQSRSEQTLSHARSSAHERHLFHGPDRHRLRVRSRCQDCRCQRRWESPTSF